MISIPQITTKKIFVGEVPLTFNPQTLITTIFLSLCLTLLASLFSRSLTMFPSRRQCLIEIFLQGFRRMVEEGLGEDWKKFYPLITTLFVFVLFCNWIGVVPGIKAPTADLNTCLGLGLMVFFISHFSALRKIGFRRYLKKYFSPFPLLFPLNLISELGKVISHSFRLFGNMFGGGIIFAVVGPIVFEISKSIGISPFLTSPFLLLLFLILQAFFGLFIGTVQAFVFSVLALTYIAFAREE
ncbi:MAG: ATP synthase F0 subunit A [Candidatus Omnitrophota bacterium]|nr:MAG: ATP synthase F0 subunit A [Candidatus Omnitrophota bacterium]